MFRQAPSFPYHDLGIVEDGNTASRAISKDAYVIWKGSSYFASTDILQGATLEEDVNLTAIPDGVINGVVEAVNNNLNPTSIVLSSGSYYTPAFRSPGTGMCGVYSGFTKTPQSVTASNVATYDSETWKTLSVESFYREGQTLYVFFNIVGLNISNGSHGMRGTLNITY